MLKIRLARGGRKKLPYYRIVIANDKAPRDGDFIAKIGTYNPLLEDRNARAVIDKAEFDRWVSNGAQPTETVARLYKNLYSTSNDVVSNEKISRKSR